MGFFSKLLTGITGKIGDDEQNLIAQIVSNVDPEVYFVKPYSYSHEKLSNTGFYALSLGDWIELGILKKAEIGYQGVQMGFDISKRTQFLKAKDHFINEKHKYNAERLIRSLYLIKEVRTKSDDRELYIYDRYKVYKDRRIGATTQASYGERHIEAKKIQSIGYLSEILNNNKIVHEILSKQESALSELAKDEAFSNYKLWEI